MKIIQEIMQKKYRKHENHSKQENSMQTQLSQIRVGEGRMQFLNPSKNPGLVTSLSCALRDDLLPTFETVIV